MDYSSEYFKNSQSKDISVASNQTQDFQYFGWGTRHYLADFSRNQTGIISIVHLFEAFNTTKFKSVGAAMLRRFLQGPWKIVTN